MLYVKESGGDYRPAKPNEVLKAARSAAARKYLRKGQMLSPEKVKEFLLYALQGRDSECFCVLFLDSQHAVISFDEMFTGTIDGASVYPREVAKMALQHNAKAVIFAHNHPSGLANPSQADQIITERLKECLKLFDICCLDHLIVGEGEPYSFAEHSMI